MAFSALIRTLTRSSLTDELLKTLYHQKTLDLMGAPRLVKGLISSALAQADNKHLLVITATSEEAGRWTAQLELMGWGGVNFYPAPVLSLDGSNLGDSEVIWGQMQVLGELTSNSDRPLTIITTTKSLESHLPSVEEWAGFSLYLAKNSLQDLEKISEDLTRLGYERVNLVETEGQWSRRGDIVDIFPVSSEFPVRLEWFGDQLERIREFSPTSQRSLDPIDQITITPTGFDFINHSNYQANILDYLPSNTLVAIDEIDQCIAHDQEFKNIVQELSKQFLSLKFRELVTNDGGINLASKNLPVLPHQFAKIAEILRDYQKQSYTTWMVSAQPSRSVSLLQEHDCSCQFVPNPRDFRAIEKLQIQHSTVAVKYSGIAELEGFILPTFRIILVSDREFFGQQSLANFTYIRKRRQATSKQIDPNKLRPGDYVVHRQHGIGQFIQLESLTFDGQTREYLTLKYADGTLRVVADQLGGLSRYRHHSDTPPQLHRLAGTTWEKTKAKAKKAIKKIAFDLLKLYTERSAAQGFTYPADGPWQKELEDSFCFQPTPDQLKATQDIKRDMESPRPMDRLVCGDVGFGKTEVAIRAIFKAVTSGKQVILLAPTTILTQQHYHTLKERFAPYPINIGLLNRFRTLEERREIVRRLATGELDIVVGTHQLLNKEVVYRDLGLLVIDEEQRFGVNQKEKIKTIKSKVDVLTLSATPIPRTLYMSLSGIREMSLITTPPPSRREIKTHLASYNREAIATAIRQELARAGQIFYVVPKVEGIESKAAQIQEMIPSCRIAIAHGQMEAAELETMMLAFSNGEADLLVCTTIVESGLDIPRVNTIIIEDAQKFGLAQLYQLRGRVGRSGIQAHAWLFYPNRETLTEQARKRLRAIQEFSQLGSGYQLATRDMEIRGVGNLLGAEQSGQMDLIGFDLYMEMLQESINEIKGQEIPQVDDTQIDLNITAFIPTDYIPDLDQKMAAYRAVAAATSKDELVLIMAEWNDRYGAIPKPAQQLCQVMELKQITRKLGFTRVKLEGKQHIILETTMAEPAWNLLAEKLPQTHRSRFVYGTGKVTARGLGVMSPIDQLVLLINVLGKLIG